MKNLGFDLEFHIDLKHDPCINICFCQQNYMREEVKEKLKWNVNRTSPSNKIRDLMTWTKDIMKDISYQRRILHNPIAMLFTKGW